MSVRLSLLLATGLVLIAPSASAFCRATTCNPADPSENCQRDDEHCLITGDPLFWSSSCVSFSVQADGSRRHDVSYDELVSLTEAAFATWLDVECDGGSPALRVADAGPAECGVSEYNKDKRNAYVVMFRDEDWPYLGAEDTLGLTTLRFDPTTGELYDADIEINGTENITVGDSEVEDDLASILTHEVGHFLGLSHTLSPDATMLAGYEAGSTALRSLEQDDIDGVCSMYPPDRKASSSSCEPRHGFASECGPFQTEPPLSASKGAEEESGGCSVATPGRSSAPSPFFLALAASGLAAALCRRVRR